MRYIIAGYRARDALLRRVRHSQRHPRRRRRPLLPQNADGLDRLGPRLAHHILGMVSCRCKLSPQRHFQYFLCRFAYSYLKHHGYIEFSGMKGCYFCYYPFAAQTTTISAAAISGTK